MSFIFKHDENYRETFTFSNLFVYLPSVFPPPFSSDGLAASFREDLG